MDSTVLVSKHSIKQLPVPTTAEFAILQVLWRRGACTVRKVHEVLKSGEHTGYTTTLKTMQIMYKKGFVVRDDRLKAHVYKANCTAIETRKRYLSNLLEGVFQGSSYQMLELTLEISKPLEESEIELLASVISSENTKTEG